jgi:diaminopimelate epimerase
MNFTKMQAAGNDFIMIDARNMKADWNKLAIDMCRIHFGIGADGLILVDKNKPGGLVMRIFNADGSEAEVCGNGLRCFAKYVVDNKIARGPDINVTTLSGIKETRVFTSKGNVKKAKVNMGKPVLKARDIPVNVEGNLSKRNRELFVSDYPLTVSGKKLSLSFVSMGNPHAVHFIKTPVDTFPLEKIGPQVEKNRIFPKKTNFEIAHIIDDNRIEARVWERGVGETLACGSGACAIAVAARLNKLTTDRVDIIMRGGMLTIDWDGRGDIFMTGPVENVFSGVWQK